MYLVEKVTTEDGSLSARSEQFGETYHSIHGAETETRHIYIEGALKHRLQCQEAEDVLRPCYVLEMGFGTGLGALLTAREAKALCRPVEYHTWELYPLEPEKAKQWGDPEDALFATLHRSPWGVPCALSRHFTLLKIEKDLTHSVLPHHFYDVVYYDAFSPEKQPELWSAEIFAQIFAAMRPQGVLTTYCAKGVVRRTLQEAGFTVERLAGPPGGKREILRATKPRG